ncbi:hypothetical protein SAMN02745181_3632 [Rubritalea squalenifaciens DSM 18772]|uniref:Uncharacterized protein n=1 Tax=Rubritalea squalenifaciens DSM 18772 TaxID=1123071 RepID=A0A1M6RLH1_9BACT|nr:hypothetical protein [Rubritalea squalenifaciens]SHK33260.1 hypothetical protein SAMN02745181_3632 [Rubritalea squalenifaciens DSM 18772]
MKVLTLLCALIIGVVVGAGLNHKSQIGTALHVLNTQSAQEADNLDKATDQDSNTLPAFQGTPAVPTTVEKTIYQSNPEDAVKVAKLESDFAKLSKKYEFLSTQLLEANREIQSLRFIVDTHSESFRPLRTEQNKENSNSFSPPAGLSPLLPPRE